MKALGLSTFFAVALVASQAGAGPIVAAGGKPAIATSWKTQGADVVIVLAPGFKAEDVAKVIQAGVPGVTARVAGSNVAVTGMPEAKLITALEKVELPDGGDDVDAMLANLRGGGASDEESSGSSIRATQAADFSEVLGKKEELITAKVVDVKRQRFPLVLVTVKVGTMPKGVTIAGVKNGSKVTVLPRVKSKNGVVDPSDEASQLNVGAWYVEPGDTVLLRLEPEQQDNVWIAAAFDRRVK